MIRSHLHKAWQAGLSLIELMVGLTIGLFLTLGMFVLITNP
ncbi:MAG: prepilin-type N-terminal cleavage/methylation domain-containing protein [Gammaproteobacteria bacterium]|nr:prepilin-type N-terminal cleavage/methylation domain-containing protein [Gammaproteobacteria bacterium]